ncbi:MAG: polyphosphate kinase 1 [Bacteroidales bacterium]|nr:polyphosphate kinase 1 [Bacteroidales bacterium]MCF8336807.1 polyphosphate kinase 1 [Bacteroidales bacterium]
MIALDNKKLINREISWLHFNGRVLQEAMDTATPLLERVKFLGIFSNNRDEFFRVRIATLKRMLKYWELEGRDTKPVQDVLDEIDRIVKEQERTFTWTYRKIVFELYRENIVLLNEKQLTRQQGRIVRKHFRQKVRPYIFPIMLDLLENISTLKDKSIYLAVVCRDSRDENNVDYALVKVPSKVHSRFFTFPPEIGENHMILLDDIIRYCLDDVFGVFGFDTFEAYTIKFTRDAELDLDYDVSKSFVETMYESVKKRKRGNPVRFVYDEKMPEKLIKKLRKKLSLKNDDDIRAGGRYHNFKDFMEFPDFDKPKLYFEAMPPMFHPDLPINQSVFDTLKQKDIILHYPYQSFQHIVDWLREASIDPKVISIKMTFYRTARYSNVVNALVNAARSGKSVTVFMELQARFDEEANIQLTEKFREEGVKVIQAIPGYKVHSKLIFIRRREEQGNMNYVNISTGNFNETTARSYADDSILTANQEIADDVNRTFHLFEERYVQPQLNALITAPFYMREFFMEMLDNEMRHAMQGREARAVLKLNNLTDRTIAEKIYEASQAGVKITLIVRGICVIIPGIEGLSENIEAFSIVDRFLEHSRVLVFHNNNDPRFYITSADWMPRNFDHRIETCMPVYDKTIQQELMDMLKIQMQDNQKARNISKENPNQYRNTGREEKVRSQVEIYNYLKQKYSTKAKIVEQED